MQEVCLEQVEAHREGWEGEGCLDKHPRARHKGQEDCLGPLADSALQREVDCSRALKVCLPRLGWNHLQNP